MTEAVVSARGAARLRAGGPFVARADVVAAPPEGSDVVRVRDGRGAPLGTALWAAAGPIALRWLGRGDLKLDEELLLMRIAAAEQRRREWLARSALPGADAYRVVHGEADGLPGLFIDRYADSLVLQTATRAMDARAEEIGRLAAAALGASRAVLRDDGSARDLEGLPRRRAVLCGPPSGLQRFHDAGMPMEVDLLGGSKTGSFLDQQENHARAYALARAYRGGRALDCFTYRGGFALQLARAGLEVLACDESPEAIRGARRNAALAALPMDFRQANAFDLLRALEAEGRRFHVIVLDPPALGKRGRGRPGPGAPGNDPARRAYKELNLRALRLLEPGGLLLTCSCSARVRPADFDAILGEAARDAGRQVQLLERRGAAEDHPVLLGVPETEYLKCWALRSLS